VEKYEIKEPEDRESVLRYLSSGAVKGIGEALAARIVKKFGNETIRIMEEEPERLSEVKGISERMAMSISAQFEEKKDMRKAMLFLTRYGIGMNLSAKIYKQYGENLYSIIRENPYQLADDITGVGFKIADEIASKAGIQADSEFRIKSGILYTLTQASGQGHMFLPEEELLSRCAELLNVPADGMHEYLSDMQMDRRIVLKKADEKTDVYLSRFYYTEMNTAAMLHDLDIRSDEDPENILQVIGELEKEDHMQFDGLQKKAVVEAAHSGVLILTGGPGTGKTTTINAIIRYFEHEEMEILLAAPTGRAAKRMTEATGHEAKTIHRLLEITGIPSEENGKPGDLSGMHFERNEEMPLEADCVIIDEMSMVDIHLMCALLKAVSVGTHLILVGDMNQLPSVGPGNVLRDLIDSGCINVVRLNQIYRQAAESDIVMNAHKMIRREKIDLTRRSRDFLFIRQGRSGRHRSAHSHAA
jgi:exodeoxyribonuclease V alpha subunit